MTKYRKHQNSNPLAHSFSNKFHAPKRNKNTTFNTSKQKIKKQISIRIGDLTCILHPKERQLHTLTVSLWLSGKGLPSLGFTTLYFPTVMALLFISSEMHFVFPEVRSNLMHSPILDKSPIQKITFMPNFNTYICEFG